MEWISLSTIITTIVVAVGGVFCSPFFACFRSSVEALLNPQSLDEDSKNFMGLLKELYFMRDRKEISIWIDDAMELKDQIKQLRMLAISGSSKHNNGDHLASCLCGDACARCSLRGKIKEMIARGENAKRLISDEEELQGESGTSNEEEFRPTFLRKKAMIVRGENAKRLISDVKELRSLSTGDEESQSWTLDEEELRPVEPRQKAMIARREDPKRLISDEKELQILSLGEEESQSSTSDEEELRPIEPRKGLKEAEHTDQDVLMEDFEFPGVLIGAVDEHIPFLKAATDKEIQLDVERETLGHILHASGEAAEDIPYVSNIQYGTTAEGKLKRVMEAFNDDDVWCVGVWGPGGVGKSTLVKAANNKLKSNSSFTLVILMELRGNDGDKEVQEVIAGSLGLNMEERIEERIHNTLQGRKFLLILDNVWKSINLQSIGVPVRQKGSKIILTTRSKRVCTKMDAEEIIEMGYLTKAEAWRLFAEKAGEVVNDEKIKPEAKRVCDECGGWPLALVVVGSAMKEEKNFDEWQNAIRNKQEIIPTDSVLKAKVYEPLELSYDRLDDTLKSCFLYCSIYPEGYNIEINELVQCWLAENVIDEGLPYKEAYSKGLDLIKKLKGSCLLEQVVDGDDWGPQTVKMHDVLRDFAIWIGNHGKSTNKSVVISGHGIYLSPIVRLPEEDKNIQWISFVDNGEIKLTKHEKDYSSVTTLLLRGTNYNEKLEVSTEFLKGFEAVKVLNMEQVQLFDASRLQLKELRALILRKCSYIEKLPTTNNPNVGWSSGISSFSAISGALGASFSKLRILRIWELAGVVFPSNDLHIRLPELESIFVCQCKETVVFDCGPAEIQSIAPKLRILEVEDSYDLKSLCKYESNEHWISLEILSVKNCPGLKKLPSMPSIKEIRGSLEWWNKVEWDSEDIKLRMNQCFKPLD